MRRANDWISLLVGSEDAAETNHNSHGEAASATRPGAMDEEIAAGTIVLTLDGEIPVEWLQNDDRVITRAGARALRAVSSRPVAGSGRAHATLYRLHFDQRQIFYADGVEIASSAS